MLPFVLGVWCKPSARFGAEGPTMRVASPRSGAVILFASARGHSVKRILQNENAYDRLARRFGS
jgi:hypothetical protein